jgi:hypothetical protein
MVVKWPVVIFTLNQTLSTFFNQFFSVFFCVKVSEVKRFQYQNYAVTMRLSSSVSRAIYGGLRYAANEGGLQWKRSLTQHNTSGSSS